ncbi:MAG: deoxyribodipyrimidine photo-lyase, partial [Hyphomicrobiales bacterium]|nr:deoxyribodipyrimidine photo-lyase [Hyphomicrobiales bacterium]
MRSRTVRQSAPPPAIVWFRDDLRLADNPALDAAVASGSPLICIYVQDEESDGLRSLGGAAKWWLHGALDDLQASLRHLGGELVIMRGASAQLLERLAIETGARTVFWNRRYDGASRAIDAKLEAALTARGVTVESFGANLLHEPWTLETSSGEPFRVFTPFWRAARANTEPRTPLPPPKRIEHRPLPNGFESLTSTLESLTLEPSSPDWAAGLRACWRRGEKAGLARLCAFLESGLSGYAANRDRPDKAATSRLSPYLRFGNLSPRQVWHAAAT